MLTTAGRYYMSFRLSEMSYFLSLPSDNKTLTLSRLLQTFKIPDRILYVRNCQGMGSWDTKCFQVSWLQGNLFVMTDSVMTFSVWWEKVEERMWNRVNCLFTCIYLMYQLQRLLSVATANTNYILTCIKIHLKTGMILLICYHNFKQDKKYCQTLAELVIPCGFQINNEKSPFVASTTIIHSDYVINSIAFDRR